MSKIDITKLLEEGCAEDIFDKYLDQASANADKLSTLLDKYDRTVAESKMFYYSLYDIKNYARQLEDIVDQLTKIVETTEKQKPNSPYAEGEEASGEVIAELSKATLTSYRHKAIRQNVTDGATRSKMTGVEGGKLGNKVRKRYDAIDKAEVKIKESTEVTDKVNKYMNILSTLKD